MYRVYSKPEIVPNSSPNINLELSREFHQKFSPLYKMADLALPRPAYLHDIIYDLFQNEKIQYPDGRKVIITFSRFTLTEDQKKQLVYPEGFIPLDFILGYQTDVFDAEGNLSSTTLDLTSFAKKNDDGFIYGIYFDVTDQERFSICRLRSSPQSIEFSSTAKFTSSSYIEIYNNINGTTVLLGFSSKIDSLSASLQYSTNQKYYYEELNSNGLTNISPSTELTGLSRNFYRSA